MHTQVKFKYTDTALPTGSTTVSIFDTTVAFPGANYLDTTGIARIKVAIVNDQAGTLKASMSNDRGATWTRIVADISVSAAAANTDNQYDFDVEGYADWRLQWTNGGSNQGTFIVNVMGTGQRHIAN